VLELVEPSAENEERKKKIATRVARL
jgi:hypothetical protein